MPGENNNHARGESVVAETAIIDFPIIDSHVHLLDPKRLGYSWTSGAPSLNRLVLPADLMAAAAPVKIDGFVFVEVDVDLPQHVAEAEWIDELAKSTPALKGSVAALPLEQGRSRRTSSGWQLKSLRGIRRLIQNQPDPDFCIAGFHRQVKLLAAHDLVFDICVFHHHLPNVIKMVEKCPECASSSTISASPASGGLIDRGART